MSGPVGYDEDVCFYSESDEGFEQPGVTRSNLPS